MTEKAIFSHKSKIPLIRVNGPCCRAVQDLPAEKSQHGNSCCGAEPQPTSCSSGAQLQPGAAFPGWKNALEWVWGHTQSSGFRGQKPMQLWGGKEVWGLCEGRVLEEVKMLSSNLKILKKHFYRTKTTSESCSRSQTEQTAHSYIGASILKNNTNTCMLLWKFRQNASFSASTKQTFAVYILTKISPFFNLLNSQSVFPARGLGKARTVPRSSTER